MKKLQLSQISRSINWLLKEVAFVGSLSLLHLQYRNASVPSHQVKQQLFTNIVKRLTMDNYFVYRNLIYNQKKDLRVLYSEHKNHDVFVAFGDCEKMFCHGLCNEHGMNKPDAYKICRTCNLFITDNDK